MMSSAAARLVLLPLLLTSVGCGQDPQSGSAGDGGPESGVAATASFEFEEDFEDRACERLTEAEVREIFDVAPEVEMTVGRFSPCAYEWEMALPGQPETTAEFMAGVSYVVTVADDAAGAERRFASLSEGVSAEEMEARAEDAAGAAADESDLSDEQRAEVERAAEDLFGQELTYEALQGVGDQAAWEQTHGSLLVLAGNAVFRTIAQSNYGDPETRQLVTDNYPQLAAEVARATLD